MPRPFPELRERLLRAGVAPRHIRRYIAELSDHLADLTAEEQQAGLPPAAAQSAALNRLGDIDTLAQAMIQQRRFQSWTARAPWAVFGITPLVLLASLWIIALALLWYGWQLFLPGALTPFGSAPAPHKLDNLRNIYFQLDRALYFAAPILVGWWLGLIAARQRSKALWPILGLTLLALLGAMAQIQADRNAIPSGFGHIRMSFALRSPAQTEYALVVLLIALLPYLIWRIRAVLFHPA